MKSRIPIGSTNSGLFSDFENTNFKTLRDNIPEANASFFLNHKEIKKNTLSRYAGYEIKLIKPEGGFAAEKNYFFSWGSEKKQRLIH